MVFVTVGDDDGFDLVFDDMQVGEIRYEDIHTVHRLIRETHSDIDDNGSGLRFEYRHVPADLTETAQRCETYFSFGVEIDLFPWGHSGLLNAFVLLDGSAHCFIDRRYILAFAATAFVLVFVLVPTVLIVSGFSVLAVLLVGIAASSVLAVPLFLIAVGLSVRVWFPVRVRFSVGIVPLSILTLLGVPLSAFTLCICIVRSVLSVRVWSSAPLRGIALCFTVLRFWLLILRVSAVLFVVFHLNYPLIHYISDDK